MRLRILRLCSDREWTNKELADRLQRDPATILHHVRLLVDAGLIEPVGVRQGASGAYEKPYRSTGLSWQLSFERPMRTRRRPARSPCSRPSGRSWPSPAPTRSPS